MKIAQFAPVLATVPPEKYGGVERIVNDLCLGLRDARHEVTLFAPRGSAHGWRGITHVENAPFPTLQEPSATRLWEISAFLHLLSQQDRFDIIHLHMEPAILHTIIDTNDYNFLDYFSTPIIMTFHSNTHSSDYLSYYQATSSLQKHAYVFISKNQSEPMPMFPEQRLIYNGIPIEKFDYSEEHDDYLLFIGRLSPTKGIVEAIQVAQQTKKRLIIAGAVHEPDREFFEKKVKPFIDNTQIQNVGEVSFAETVKYYRHALAVLCPIQWEEPFGLVFVEAMACGTPVIAFRRGSVPEIIRDGETGFIVDSINGMVRAVEHMPTISRAVCRKHVEDHFTSRRMVREYASYYSDIVSSRRMVR